MAELWHCDHLQGENFPVALRISPKSLARVLTVTVLSLTFVNIAIELLIYIQGYDRHLAFARLFTFKGNASVPKWFASSELLLSALLLATIAWVKIGEGDRYGRHWSALALIFCAISLEEAVGFHELAGELVGLVIHTSGLLYNTWTLLGIIFTPIVALIYSRFLFHLHPKTRGLFLLAAIFYVGGALGLEIIRGPYIEAYGVENMTYAMLKTFEEFCQMIGIVVFIDALLSYIGAHVKEIRVSIDNQASTD
jgi:hypothetical protein